MAFFIKIYEMHKLYVFPIYPKTKNNNKDHVYNMLVCYYFLMNSMEFLNVFC